MESNITVDLRKLAERWCERRALLPLRHFLPGFFALNGLSDGHHDCIIALKDVLAFGNGDITQEEREEVKTLIRRMEAVLVNR